MFLEPAKREFRVTIQCHERNTRILKIHNRPEIENFIRKRQYQFHH